jgi:hypothetical protein
MKLFEPSGKEIIVFAVMGVVALLIVGALGTGASSYLYNLGVPNTTSGAVVVISGTVLPILFLVAIVLKFI